LGDMTSIPAWADLSIREKSAIVAFILLWLGWKAYKFTLMEQYGPFSWEFWRPTLLVPGAFLVGVMLLVALSRRRRAGQSAPR